MKRDLSTEDLEGLLHSHSQRFANAQFAQLDDHWTPCSAGESFTMTFFAFVLAIVAPVAVIAWRFA